MKVTKLVLGSSLILGSLVIGQIGAFAGETGILLAQRQMLNIQSIQIRLIQPIQPIQAMKLNQIQKILVLEMLVR